MNTDIKQAMHVEAGKSFGTAEANENERRWDDDKIERKNQDPTNHYDKSRMGLNFEIGPDGKIHPLGYQQKSLEVRLMDRLAELGWHPFKADSKIQPNCCARFIFGGNHDRTLEMAFGDQTVNPDKLLHSVCRWWVWLMPSAEFRVAISILRLRWVYGFRSE